MRDSLSPGTPDLTYQGIYLGIYIIRPDIIIMAKTNKFNVPNGLMNQGKVADIHASVSMLCHSSEFNKILSRLFCTFSHGKDTFFL